MGTAFQKAYFLHVFFSHPPVAYRIKSQSVPYFDLDRFGLLLRIHYVLQKVILGILLRTIQRFQIGILMSENSLMVFSKILLRNYLYDIVVSHHHL